MDANNVAIYLDFENLAISAETVYPSQDKPLNIEPIIDFASSKGVVCVKKAYADWSKEIFSQYQGLMMEQGFELIHLPETNLQGKNGSDVRLAVDVMEHLELFPSINTLIIGSGDSDFIPLIQRVKSRNIKVLIIGFEHSVGRLVKKNSVEFKALEELLGEPEEESPSSYLKEEIDHGYGKELLIRYVKNRGEDGPVLMAKLKQHLLRMDPTFSEKEMGYTSFKSFLHSMKGEVVKDISSHNGTLPQVYFNDFIPVEQKKVSVRDSASVFLNRKIRYQKDTHKRIMMATALFYALSSNQPLSMSEMFEYVYEGNLDDLPRTEIKKYINTLFTGGSFKAAEQHNHSPLLSRPFILKETIRSPEALDQIYIQRVSEILQSRYPTLADQDILELLI
ncbi:MAG: NYN domain-containing protein [Bacteroidota bacterium]